MYVMRNERNERETKEKAMTKKERAKAHLGELATRLAGELGIETLEVRNLDRHDFHEVHVSALKRVIQRAFVLGMQATETERSNIEHYNEAL